MDVLGWISRTLALLSGGLLCYAALFLYESQERRVQNVLETWWIRIDDIGRDAVSWHVAFMIGTAGAASRALDRLFGERLISSRIVAVSACLSLASFYFLASAVALWIDAIGRITPEMIGANFQDPDDQVIARALVAAAKLGRLLLLPAVPGDITYMNVIGLIALLAVISGTVFARLRRLPLFMIIAVLVFFSVLEVFGATTNVSSPTTVLVVVLTGVACDLGAFALTRSLLRRQLTWRSATALSASVVGQLLIAVMLLVGPAIGGAFVLRQAFHTITTSEGTRGWTTLLVGWSFVLSAFTNGFALVVTLSFFIAALLLLLHRVIWPIIERPLYRLVRIGVLTTTIGRSAVLTVGGGLIAVGTGQASDLASYIRALLSSV